MKKITIDEALIMSKNNKGIIIDVRTPFEFESIHLKESYNLPLDKIDSYTNELNKFDKKMFFICKTGNRSKQACTKLSHLNNDKIYTIEGGLHMFKHKESDIIKGKERWDIERQVRFSAGSIVTIGILLGTFVNSYFYLLSIFVGVGLIFSSITNTCTMGLLLSKLPFNQVKNHTKDFIKVMKDKSDLR